LLQSQGSTRASKLDIEEQEEAPFFAPTTPLATLSKKD